MTATAYPPGWHPDPNLPAGMHRWWDGSRWTEQTGPKPGGQVPAPAAAAVTASSVAYAEPAAAEGFAQSTASSAEAVATASVTRASTKSLREKNPKTFTTFAFVGAYILIAVVTGFGLLGIVPILYSVRAFRNHERLAPLAAAAAVVGMLFLY